MVRRLSYTLPGGHSNHLPVRDREAVRASFDASGRGISRLSRRTQLPASL